MKLNVYGNGANNEGVARTIITYGSSSITVSNGQQLLDYEIPDYTPISIQAVITDGYKFKQWVYRYQTATSSQNTSTYNPFTYSGKYDLFIRAESEKVLPWTLKTTNVYIPIGSKQTFDFTLSQRNLHLFIVSFVNSGTARFYTTGNVDTFGMITETYNYSDGSSTPFDIEQYDDDSYDGSNFYFTYYVDASKSYYVWVRGNDEYTSGSTQLVIENTPTSNIAPWSWYGSNGDADEDETFDSYNALKEGTPTINFLYKVWNDIVSKVSTILDYQGVGWDGTYASFRNTKMSSSNNYLTAVRYNSVVHNIDRFVRKIGDVYGENYYSNLPFYNPEDPVMPQYITNLTNEINYWLEAL